MKRNNLYAVLFSITLAAASAPVLTSAATLSAGDYKKGSVEKTADTYADFSIQKSLKNDKAEMSDNVSASVSDSFDNQKADRIPDNLLASVSDSFDNLKPAKKGYPKPQTLDSRRPGFYLLDKTNINYTVVDEKFEAESSTDEMVKKTYELFAAGLPDDKVSILVDYMKDHINDSVLQSYLNDARLVDANKLNAADDKVDSIQCWAAATSNILWLSGWGQKAVNPLTNKNFCSEDEIMTYFTYRFCNNGSDPVKALNWFFNGHYDPAETDPDDPGASLKNPDHPAGAASLDTTDGLFKEYSAQGLYTTYNNTFSAIQEIENTNGKNSFGASIFFWNTSTQKFEDGHGLSVLGVIADPNEEYVEDRYKAIIVADSNDNSRFYNTSDNISPEDLTLKKSQCDKYYYIYSLSPVELDGDTYWKIDYKDCDDDQIPVITTLWSLQNYTDNLAEEHRETDGTMDFIHNQDFVLDENYSGVGRRVPEADSSYSLYEDGWYNENEELYFAFYYHHQGVLPFTADDSTRIKVDYTLKKDGSDFYSGTCTLASEDYYKKMGFVPMSQLLDSDNSTLTPGDYTFKANISFIDENNNEIEEAYMKNNELPEYTFTIV